MEECNEIIEEVKIVSENKNKCSSCIFYIALFSMFFTINIGIGSYFVYYKYMNHKAKMFLNTIMSIKEKIININGRSQTNIELKSNFC